MQEKLRTYNDSLKKARAEMFVEQEGSSPPGTGPAPGKGELRAGGRAEIAAGSQAGDRRGSEGGAAELEQSSGTHGGGNRRCDYCRRAFRPGRSPGGRGAMNFARRILIHASAALVGLLLLTIPVLAEEGAAPNPADSPAGVIFRWINFALVFGGIAYLIAKHGGAFFSANARAISASIREGTAAKEEADRQLQEVETKISRLDQEVSALQESARRDSVAETERLQRFRRSRDRKNSDCGARRARRHRARRQAGIACPGRIAGGGARRRTGRFPHGQ